jgi:cell division protein YceG involved in septum cleavage
MAGIGKAFKGLGLLGKKKKTGWGANLKERSRVFKEGQEKHKALDIKEGKKLKSTPERKAKAAALREHRGSKSHKAYKKLIKSIPHDLTYLKGQK